MQTPRSHAPTPPRRSIATSGPTSHVFGALLALTIATVGAWKFLHLPLAMTIALALFIAW